MKGNLNIY